MTSTCCMPRVRTFCGGSDRTKKPKKPMRRRWRWLPMRASGVSSNVACRNFATASRYNRSVKPSYRAGIALGLSLVWLAGCSRNIDSKDAVRQGILDYMAKRPDFLAMDVNVTSVSFAQNEATATVHFQAKGNSAASAGMNMQYVLERKGSQWVVKGRAGGNSHTGMPQGAPGATGSIGAMPNAGGSIGAMPNTGTGTPALPPGHPSVPGGATPSGGAASSGTTTPGALPPGHPAVNPAQSK